MTEQPRFERELHEDEGKPAAIIVWVLYLLAIPSANTLALVGLVVAYAARGRSSGWVRAHFDAQIALFWGCIFWFIALCILLVVAAVFSLALIGIPFLIAGVIALVALYIWFTVKSVFGLIASLGDRAP